MSKEQIFEWLTANRRLDEARSLSLVPTSSCQLPYNLDPTTIRYDGRYMSTISALPELMPQRCERNVCSVGLYQLPNEVLVRIFRCAQNLCIHGRNTIYDHGQTIDEFFDSEPAFMDSSWKYLMNSCSHLRQVALTTCELWRHVWFPGNALWRELCVQRAQGYPLVLFVRYDDQSAQDAARVICTHLPRASALYLAVVNFDMNDPAGHEAKGLMDILPMSGGSMQFLSITSPRSGVINMTLSTETIAALVTLAIQVACVDARSWPTFPVLRQVQLISWRVEEDRTRANALIMWLNRNPSIETLSFAPRLRDPKDHSMSQQPGQQDFLGVNLSLPFLRILKLESTPVECLNILTSLSHQPSLGLHIVVTTTPMDSRAFLDVIKYMKEFWETHSARQQQPQDLHFAIVCGHDQTYLQMGSPLIHQVLHIDQPFCILRVSLEGVPVALYKRVSVLHLIGHDDAGKLVYDGFNDISYKMSSLDTLSVDGRWSADQVDQLGHWVLQRKIVYNQPIRLLWIRVTESDEARTSFERLIASLKQQQAIGDVEWLHGIQSGKIRADTRLRRRALHSLMILTDV